MDLIGQAAKHTDADDISNLELSFKPGLFVSGVKSVDTKNIQIDFRELPVIETSGDFEEAIENDGSIRNKVTLYARNDLFDINVDPNKYIDVENLPKDIGITFKILNDKAIIASIDGNSGNHLQKDSVSLDLTFKDNLFKNKIIPENITIDIKFNDVFGAILSSDSTFREDIQNDGSIVNSVIVSIENDEIVENYEVKASSFVDNIFDFTGTNALDEDSFITINGIRVDVDLTLMQSDPTFNRLINSMVDSINNEGEGTDKVYAKKVTTIDGVPKLLLLKDEEDKIINISGKTGLGERLDNYYNNNEDKFPASIGITKEEYLATKENYAYRTYVNRTLPMKWFSSQFVSASNIPVGLTPSFRQLDDQHFLLQLNGKTKDHLDRDDINAMFNFNKILFKKEIEPTDLGVRVDFRNPEITTVGGFKETKLNDGSIEGKVTLLLSGDKFKKNIDVNSYILASGLPSGLNVDFIQEADSIIVMRLHGKALKHEKINSIKDLTLSFDKDLLQKSIKMDSVKNLSISFNNNFDEGLKGGGPGKEGGYLTFIIPEGRNIVVSAGGKDFGVDNEEFQSTITMRDAFKRVPELDQLYAIGTQEAPELILEKNQWGVGLTSISGAMLLLDSVDAAMRNLRKTQENIYTAQEKIKNTLSYLDITKVNVQAAESSMREINFAEEVNGFNKKQIIQESSNYVLSQANSLSKNRIIDLLDKNI
jgi:flagellin-like hook-associated protein FlgL